MSDAVRVTVPATSANLGPGFDSMALALSLRLQVEVRRSGSFSLETDLDVPADRSNLLVRAFERVLPADGFAFRVESQIPLCGGFGSSCCAVVAGILAARELGGECADPLALAIEIDGVADNAAAAINGGLTIHTEERTVRLDPPQGLGLLVVSPHLPVETQAARAVLPESVALGDAVANIASAAILTAGLVGGDLDLIAAGLRDRIHQSARAALFPQSAELIDHAVDMGALGATISGAGPAVLVWCDAARRDEVKQELLSRTGSWADVLEVEASGRGATIEEVG